MTKKQNEKTQSNNYIIGGVLLVGGIYAFSRLNNKINKLDKENTAKILKEDLELKLLKDYLSYEVSTSTGRRILRDITNLNVANPNFHNIFIQNSLNENIIKPGFLDNKESGAKYTPLVEDGFFGLKTTTALVDTINYALKEIEGSLDFFELIPSPSNFENINTQVISDTHWESITGRKIEDLVLGERNNEVKDNLFTVSLKYVFEYLVKNHRDFMLDLSVFFRQSGIGEIQQQRV